MKLKKNKNRGRAILGGRDITSPQWTKADVIAFWDSFIELNKIPKREFRKELEVDHNHVNALQRLFTKMNKSATTR